MKALYLTKPMSFQYNEAPSPVIAPGWVRIRMQYVGICGSDVHYYAAGRIGDQIVRYPFVLGHEGSGVVAEGADKFEKDTPAYIEPAISCHQCDQCLAGRENTCRNLKFLGNPLELSGCMCEEIALPAECVIPLPPWLGLQEAVLLEPLSIAAYAVERSRARRGCRAAIIGAGPIGLTVLLALTDIGAGRIVVSEPVEDRRSAASTLGAESTVTPGESGSGNVLYESLDGGADVAFDCAGTQESIDDATASLRPGGTLVLIGIPENPDRLTYNPHLMRRREITIMNIRRQNNAVKLAMGILERHRAAANVLITHRFEALQAADAFHGVHHKKDGVIKALLHF